jgi:D-tyrosyl-tRNA(Tyr) deacylase
MKALLQRVVSGSVTINGTVAGAIGPGLVVFLGVGVGDTEADADYLARRVAGLRVFARGDSSFDLSVEDVAGGVLVVSQFTLMADTAKGRRPSFTEAAPPELARPLYERFVAALRETGLQVATGVFQEHMHVEILNDGPVTVLLESRRR